MGYDRWMLSPISRGEASLWIMRGLEEEEEGKKKEKEENWEYLEKRIIW